jgi:hypothetical protein
MSLEARYEVYHNLEDSEERMLLPLKRGQFPVLHNDVAAASETAAANVLPTCVGVDQVPRAFLCCLRLLWEDILLRPVVCCSAGVKAKHCV